MERRFILFLVLSFAILFGYMALMSRIEPQRPPAQARKPAAAAKDDQAPKKPDQPEKAPPKDGEAAEQPPAEKPATERPAEKPREQAELQAPELVEEPTLPEQWATLGSADPADPHRMLVTLTNRGAAVARIELNSDRYRDLEDRTGYLGHVVMRDDPAANGAPVQVVGPGTPAAKAGLKPGDLIQAVGDLAVTSTASLDRAMAETKPNRQITLTVLRDGKKLKLPVTLGWRPLEVLRPENRDPLSFLMTLAQIDGQKLAAPTEKPGDEADEKDQQAAQSSLRRPAYVNRELKGVNLRDATWRIVRADGRQVVFSRRLPEWGLEATKTYRLAEIPKEKNGDPLYKAYHLVLEVEIRNIGERARKVAYQLDGPTGLPTEGWWYASKVSRTWGSVGLRDMAISLEGGSPALISCTSIADDEAPPPWQDATVNYVGVDAQYFAAAILPRGEGGRNRFAEVQALRVGAVDPELKNLTNVSTRLVSSVKELAPGGEETLKTTFDIFAGPKKPDLLAQYGLGELVYYGWFGWVAVPMVNTLHFFNDWVVFNYGLAIIMLTILVRACMFPLSRKQALGAQKMQEIQPELKKLQEKYKKDREGMVRAQQELFRKHNYNPFSGCLVLLVQLPIFLGLYRGLMVDIELRGSPLISQAVRWCSNLAAPDMLLDWSGFMPEFISRGIGIFGLGPYFNLLPILTIVLFIWQQKMFMPPPTDEQSAMQQKVMQYMMIFMGILFFKVAAGLCIYFIATSLWSLAERKLLPKVSAQAAGGAKPDLPSSPAAGNNGSGGRNKKRAKRK